jgi:hypothetical protein
MKTKRVSDEPKVVSPAVAALLKALFIVVMTTLFLHAEGQQKATSLFQWGQELSRQDEPSIVLAHVQVIFAGHESPCVHCEGASRTLCLSAIWSSVRRAS